VRSTTALPTSMPLVGAHVAWSHMSRAHAHALAHDAVRATQFFRAHLAVVIGVEQGEMLLVLAFQLRNGHLAITIDVQTAGRCTGTTFELALLDEGHKLFLGKLTVTVGVGRLQRIDATLAEFFRRDEPVLVCIDPAKTTALVVLGSCGFLRGGSLILCNRQRAGNNGNGYSRQEDFA